MDEKKHFYRENGYVIFPNLISHEKIDQIIEEFSKFKKNNQLFYSQSHHNWRRTKRDIDKSGLLKTSLQDFTNLIFANKFTKLGRDILQSKEVLNCLRRISDNNDFYMWQNMFFDKSTGTINHIDTWHLDTSPRGFMIAGWFALENSTKNGGYFHIYPSSHKENLDNCIGMDHKKFRLWSKKLTLKYKKSSFLLKKGDVLFWHPFLLHGSSSQLSDGNGRKSLTSHYIPSDFIRNVNSCIDDSFINDKKSEQYIKELKLQQKSTRNFGYPISSSYSRRKIFLNYIKGWIRYTLNFHNDEKMLMSEDDYK